MPINGELFKRIGRSAAGPVCIVAAYDRNTGAIVALTASSFVTLSFDPPMVMFALQQSADSYSSIASSEAFGVSLLHHSQHEVATLFSKKGREKIERTAFVQGATLRCPLIPDSLAHVECATIRSSRVGITLSSSESWKGHRFAPRETRCCISTGNTGALSRCEPHKRPEAFTPSAVGAVCWQSASSDRTRSRKACPRS
jgi:hypothetical protein